jgi:hypothetical protein
MKPDYPLVAMAFPVALLGGILFKSAPHHMPMDYLGAVVAYVAALACIVRGLVPQIPK